MFQEYYEQSVKSPKTYKTRLRKVLSWVVGVIVAAFILYLIRYTAGTVLPVVQFGMAAMALYFARMSAKWVDKEYDYTLTGDRFTVDKVISQSRRYPVAAINLTDVEEFGKYAPETVNLSQYNKTVYACGGEMQKHYLVINSRRHGRSILIFSPDETMLESINHFLPYNLRNKRQ